MTKLTDLEICKRIAEIESVSFMELSEAVIRLSEPDGSGEPQEAIEPYNPLTDDALLNQLIFKHEVSVNFSICEVSMVTNKYHSMDFNDIPSLKRNILLLIIEAYK